MHRCRRPSRHRSTRTGAPRTISPSGRSICSTTRLLRRPLVAADVKPRLLGHWGTSPGLNLIYAHLDRVIARDDLDCIYVIGPGHGGPAILAEHLARGELQRDVSRDRRAMRPACNGSSRQFSFPGGVPSHVAPETPGSIHEGGELGYSLSHAFGAAFDNPDLVVACVVGDGEAETGPLATSWHSNKFLDPVGDGAVLPILHLNGYKIANPAVLARIPERELTDLLVGCGWEPYLVSGDDPARVHQELAATLDHVLDEIRPIQRRAGSTATTARPRWPMIVLRTPKGWTGPKEVDGLPVEGTWRAHQVPLMDVRDKPDRLAALETWMRSYRPDELFDDAGRPLAAIVDWLPRGDRRMGANPNANGGVLLRDLTLPDFRDYAVDGRESGRAGCGGDACPRPVLARRVPAERGRAQLPPVRTGRDRVEPARRGVRGDAEDVGSRGPAGRRGARARRAGDGDPLRDHVPGLARGLPAHRSARPVLVLRGVHAHRRLDVQPAREVAEDLSNVAVAPTGRVAQLPPHVARVAAGQQRLHAPGSRLHRRRREQEGRGRARVPAARREHVAVDGRSLPPLARLRQCDRRREATATDLAVDRRRRDCTARAGSASGSGRATTTANPTS